MNVKVLASARRQVIRLPTILGSPSQEHEPTVQAVEWTQYVININVQKSYLPSVFCFMLSPYAVSKSRHITAEAADATLPKVMINLGMLTIVEMIRW